MLTLIVLPILIAFPVYLIHIIVKYGKSMEKEVFAKRYGTLTEGLKVDETMSMLYNVVVMLRMLFTCIVLIVLVDCPGL